MAIETAKIVEETEGTVDVNDGLDKATPQWTITVDKEKAAEYGMTVAQVFQLVMEDMASSTSATTNLHPEPHWPQNPSDKEIHHETIDHLRCSHGAHRNIHK